MTEEEKQEIVDRVVAAICAKLDDLPVVRMVSGPKSGTVYEERDCQGGCKCNSNCGC